MKNYKKILLFIIGILIIFPKNTYALDVNYFQIMSCGGNAILGSVNDPNSVAWLLQKLFNYMRVLGPFLVLLLSSIDYIKVIFNADDDSMKKTNKKLVTRLVLAGCLFILPTLVSLLLNVTGLTSSDTCLLN